jgi:hypothetical protein
MWRGLGLLGTVIIGFLVSIGTGTASAKDIRFIAQEPDPKTKKLSWNPSEVTIDQENDLKEPLYFILENPTGVDHEFAVHGLYEIIQEVSTTPRPGDYFTGPKAMNVMRPIHVRVKANSTLKIQVSDEGLIGDRDLGAKYLFFCPIHKDAHIGGHIIVD